MKINQLLQADQSQNTQNAAEYRFQNSFPFSVQDDASKTKQGKQYDKIDMYLNELSHISHKFEQFQQSNQYFKETEIESADLKHKNKSAPSQQRYRDISSLQRTSTISEIDSNQQAQQNEVDMYADLFDPMMDGTTQQTCLNSKSNQDQKIQNDSDQFINMLMQGNEQDESQEKLKYLGKRIVKDSVISDRYLTPSDLVFDDDQSRCEDKLEIIEQSSEQTKNQQFDLDEFLSQSQKTIPIEESSQPISQKDQDVILNQSPNEKNPIQDNESFSFCQTRKYQGDTQSQTQVRKTKHPSLSLLNNNKKLLNQIIDANSKIIQSYQKVKFVNLDDQAEQHDKEQDQQESVQSDDSDEQHDELKQSSSIIEDRFKISSIASPSGISEYTENNQTIGNTLTDLVHGMPEVSLQNIYSQQIKEQSKESSKDSIQLITESDNSPIVNRSSSINQQMAISQQRQKDRSNDIINRNEQTTECQYIKNFKKQQSVSFLPEQISERKDDLKLSNQTVKKKEVKQSLIIDNRLCEVQEQTSHKFPQPQLQTLHQRSSIVQTLTLQSRIYEFQISSNRRYLLDKYIVGTQDHLTKVEQKKEQSEQHTQTLFKPELEDIIAETPTKQLLNKLNNQVFTEKQILQYVKYMEQNCQSFKLSHDLK